MEGKPLRLIVGCLFALGLLLIIGACASDPPKIALEDLPQGDAERGAALFRESIKGAPSCSSCHQLNSARSTGPGFEGYAQRAGRRVEGESAATYTYYSIIRPARYVVSGYSNVMPSNYEEVLSEQQLADLIAYLLTLE